MSAASRLSCLRSRQEKLQNQQGGEADDGNDQIVCEPYCDRRCQSVTEPGHPHHNVFVRRPRNLFAVLTLFDLWLASKKWGFPFVLLLLFVALGAWSILYPQGILSWAKTAHLDMDVDDRSIWWVPRLIGSCLLVIVLLIAMTFNWR
jgi:hypothetical protein